MLRDVCRSALAPSDVRVSAFRELRRILLKSLASMAKQQVNVVE